MMQFQFWSTIITVITKSISATSSLKSSLLLSSWLPFILLQVYTFVGWLTLTTQRRDDLTLSSCCWQFSFFCTNINENFLNVSKRVGSCICELDFLELWLKNMFHVCAAILCQDPLSWKHILQLPSWPSSLTSNWNVCHIIPPVPHIIWGPLHHAASFIFNCISWHLVKPAHCTLYSVHTCNPRGTREHR